mgnify:CR=1 FL=1
MRQIYGTANGKLAIITKIDTALLSAATQFGCELWVSPHDLRDLTHNALVEEWTARVGSSPIQTSATKRPKFDRDRMLVVFDGVDDALATSVDLNGASGATVCAIVELDSNTATQVLFEYSVAYNSYDGLVFGIDSSAQFWTGMGPGSSSLSYQNSLKTFPINSRMLLGAQYDRSVLPNKLNQHYVLHGDADENLLFSVDKYGSATTNFGSHLSWLGSRNNGSARVLDGGFGEVMIFREKIPHNEYEEVRRLIAVKESLL